MERHGYAVSLRKIHDDGWAVTFQQHQLLASEGFAAAPTPFRAVQEAAWRALNHKPMPRPGGEGVMEQVL